MHSPLETLAAFAIAFFLGIISAIGLGLYSRILRKKAATLREQTVLA